jgi:hypothetical protein
MNLRYTPFSANQAAKLQELAKDYDFKQSQVEKLLAAAKLENSRRYLAATADEKRKLLHDRKLNDLAGHVPQWQSEIASVLYPKAADPEWLAAGEALYKQVYPNGDFQKTVAEHRLHRSLDYRFVAPNLSALGIPDNAVGAPESKRVQGVFMALRVAEKALKDLAKTLAAVPTKRQRGTPATEAKKLDGAMVKAIAKICTEAGIKPSRAPSSDFVAFLRRYMDILEIPGNAESLADYRLRERKSRK